MLLYFFPKPLSGLYVDIDQGNFLSVWLGHFIKHKPIISEECPSCITNFHSIFYYFIGQLLTIEVFDHDDPGDDEFLGRATGMCFKSLNFPAKNVFNFFF